MPLIFIHKSEEARHSGRDCRNPEHRDVFEVTVHGTGYPLPGGYDIPQLYIENHNLEVSFKLCLAKAFHKSDSGT
jgi:hypothetical protein